MAEKQNYADESGVSRIFNTMYNGSQQLLLTAKMKILGEGYWIPSEDKEIVEVPHHAQKALIRLRENDIFSICRSDYSAGVTYHVIMKWKHSERISIVRAKSMTDIIHEFNGFVVFKELYGFTEHLKDVKALNALIFQHSAWRPVHAAAKMGLLPFFQRVKQTNALKKLMQLASQPEQKYPLHIAIENQHIDMVKYMLENDDFSISITDVKGQNALHYAADTSGPMIQLLCDRPEAKGCLNRLNNDGYTPFFLSVVRCRPSCIATFQKYDAVLNILCQGRSPLHEAMLQNNSKVKDVIKTLVDASPKIVNESDPITGDTAIHWATNKLSLSAFLEMCARSVGLNAVNKTGQTALHRHTFRGDLGCVVCLASHGADVNVADSHGNTCLHIAVFNENLDIVKALLVLGADPNVSNNDGFSCRHLAGRSKSKLRKEMLHCLLIFEAQTCSSSLIGCSGFCSTEKEELESSTESVQKNVTANVDLIKQRIQVSEFDQYMQTRAIQAVKEKHKLGKKLHILISLDGGGIRGLILTMILIYIEKELGDPIADYIDWMAGTSTGSFLASVLALGRSTKQALHLYLRFKDQLFEGWTRPYNSEKLEKSLKTEMGENTTLADVQKFKLMIVATLADVHPIKLHAFRSYMLPTSLEENKKYAYDAPEGTLLWKALRCSSAAPTYFSAVDKKYVDGGLVANNPTTELMTEVHRYNALNAMNKNDSEIISIGCVLSIGTGRIPDTPVDSLNVSTSSPVESMNALRTLSVILVDQVTATEGLPVERARSWCHDLQVPYFRFSTPLSKEYVLDTKDDKEIVQMMWETAEYMFSAKTELSSLIGLLKFLKNSPHSSPKKRAPVPPASA